MNQEPIDQANNDIVRENRLPGDPPTEWDINGWGDPSIQGFGHDISINRGERIDFKIKTNSTDYRIDIYRMGHYGGMGARRVDTIEPSAELPQLQPECATDPATHLYDCGTWAVSASWGAPSDATSGIYFARLVRQDSEPASWRADNSQEDRKKRPLLHHTPTGRLDAVVLPMHSGNHGQATSTSLFGMTTADQTSFSRRQTPRGRLTTATAATAPTVDSITTTHGPTVALLEPTR